MDMHAELTAHLEVKANLIPGVYVVSTGVPIVSLSCPYFTPGEIREGMGMLDTRRTDWALSRIAAKQTLAHFLAVAGDVVPLHDIEIRKVTNGVVASVAGADFTSAHVSVTHTSGLHGAAGVVSAAEFDGIGVDVETVRAFSDDFLQSFTTIQEYDYLSTLQKHERMVAATAMWSLKEAMLKVLKTGLAVRPNTIETLAFLRKTESYDGPFLVRWTRPTSDSILSVVCYKK